MKTLYRSIIDDDDKIVRYAEESAVMSELTDMILDVLADLVKSKALVLHDVTEAKSYSGTPYISYSFDDYKPELTLYKIASNTFAQKLKKRAVEMDPNYATKKVTDSSKMIKDNVVRVWFSKTLHLSIEQYTSFDKLELWLYMDDKRADSLMIDYFTKKIDKIIKSQKR